MAKKSLFKASALAATICILSAFKAQAETEVFCRFTVFQINDRDNIEKSLGYQTVYRNQIALIRGFKLTVNSVDGSSSGGTLSVAIERDGYQAKASFSMAEVPKKIPYVHLEKGTERAQAECPISIVESYK